MLSTSDARRADPAAELASGERRVGFARRAASLPTRVGVVGPAAWVDRVGLVAPAWRRQVVAAMEPGRLDGTVLSRLGVDELVVSSDVYAQVRVELPYVCRANIATIVSADADGVFAPALSPSVRWFKRALDVSGGMAALVLSAPVILAGAIAVKLESPGPVLFKQVRPGRDGRSFTMLKLRTMTVGNDDHEHREYVASLIDGSGVAHDGMFKLTSDPRVTRVGRVLRRYSLDELPQLLNVVAGTMSLVGPRPPVAAEVDHYQAAHWMRLRVKPGLTGAWQVAGRCELSYDEMVRLDVDYWRHWSIRNELRILLRTVPAVLSGRGAA